MMASVIRGAYLSCSLVCLPVKTYYTLTILTHLMGIPRVLGRRKLFCCVYQVITYRYTYG